MSSLTCDGMREALELVTVLRHGNEPGQAGSQGTAKLSLACAGMREALELVIMLRIGNEPGRAGSQGTAKLSLACDGIREALELVTVLTGAVPREPCLRGGVRLRSLAKARRFASSRFAVETTVALVAVTAALREASAAEAAHAAAAEARAAVVRGSAWAAARTRRRPWAFRHGSTSRTAACVVTASSRSAERANPTAALSA